MKRRLQPALLVAEPVVKQVENSAISAAPPSDSASAAPSGLHRNVRRAAAVIVAVGSGLLGLTAASAYFKSASGTHAGSATVGTLI